MEQAPQGKAQAQAEGQGGDAVQVEARDVAQAEAWVEWAVIFQAPVQVDSVCAPRAALPSLIRSARPVITSVALNAALT